MQHVRGLLSLGPKAWSVFGALLLFVGVGSGCSLRPPGNDVTFSIDTRALAESYNHSAAKQMGAVAQGVGTAPSQFFADPNSSDPANGFSCLAVSVDGVGISQYRLPLGKNFSEENPYKSLPRNIQFHRLSSSSTSETFTFPLANTGLHTIQIWGIQSSDGISCPNLEKMDEEEELEDWFSRQNPGPNVEFDVYSLAAKEVFVSGKTTEDFSLGSNWATDLQSRKVFKDVYVTLDETTTSNLASATSLSGTCSEKGGKVWVIGRERSGATRAFVNETYCTASRFFSVNVATELATGTWDLIVGHGVVSSGKETFKDAIVRARPVLYESVTRTPTPQVEIKNVEMKSILVRETSEPNILKLQVSGSCLANGSGSYAVKVKPCGTESGWSFDCSPVGTFSGLVDLLESDWKRAWQAENSCKFRAWQLNNQTQTFANHEFETASGIPLSAALTLRETEGLSEYIIPYSTTGLPNRPLEIGTKSFSLRHNLAISGLNFTGEGSLTIAPGAELVVNGQISHFSRLKVDGTLILKALQGQDRVVDFPSHTDTQPAQPGYGRLVLQGPGTFKVKGVLPSHLVLEPGAKLETIGDVRIAPMAIPTGDPQLQVLFTNSSLVLKDPLYVPGTVKLVDSAVVSTSGDSSAQNLKFIGHYQRTPTTGLGSYSPPDANLVIGETTHFTFGQSDMYQFLGSPPWTEALTNIEPSTDFTTACVQWRGGAVVADQCDGPFRSMQQMCLSSSMSWMGDSFAGECKPSLPQFNYSSNGETRNTFILSPPDQRTLAPNNVASGSSYTLIGVQKSNPITNITPTCLQSYNGTCSSFKIDPARQDLIFYPGTGVVQFMPNATTVTATYTLYIQAKNASGAVIGESPLTISIQP